MAATTDHLKPGDQASPSEPSGPPEPINRSRSRKMALAVLVGLSLVYLVSVIYRPEEPGPDGQYFTICTFKNATGLPCPGCGLTHSFCALGKGDLSGAVRFNLMGPPLFLLSTLFWLRSAFFLAGSEGKAEALDAVMARFKVVWVFLIALVVFGVARIIFLLSQ